MEIKYMCWWMYSNGIKCIVNLGLDEIGTCVYMVEG